tara:strand:- start:2462 stop:3151 length:690 start_codon:yes stop_codon:yes gene_type:complete
MGKIKKSKSMVIKSTKYTLPSNNVNKTFNEENMYYITFIYINFVKPILNQQYHNLIDHQDIIENLNKKIEISSDNYQKIFYNFLIDLVTVCNNNSCLATQVVIDKRQVDKCIGEQKLLKENINKLENLLKKATDDCDKDMTFVSVDIEASAKAKNIPLLAILGGACGPLGITQAYYYLHFHKYYNPCIPIDNSKFKLIYNYLNKLGFEEDPCTGTSPAYDALYDLDEEI